MKFTAIILFIAFLCISGLHAHTASTESIMQVIQGNGYPAENYTAVTEDGWSLSLIRIPYGKNGTVTRKGVFFFQHGVTDCAAGSILNPPYESFPYILADLGYDVWLGNNRGNGVSMTHKNYKPDQDEFWDFTWDDMGKYDFPAQVNFILNFTNKTKLSLAGHSQGTAQVFAGLIENPKMAEKLNIYIAFAPVAYVHNVGDILIRYLADIPDDILYLILGKKGFEVGPVIHDILPGFCKLFPHMCTNDLDSVCGPTQYWNATRVPFYLDYEPNPTSVKDMIHWVQEVRQQKFQKYDYGSPSENMKHYNQTTPPQYDLSKFPSNLPTVLFTGGLDYFADPADVALLVKQINNPVQIVYQPKYAHLDPLLGYEAWKLTYPTVVELLNKYSTNN